MKVTVSLLVRVVMGILDPSMNILRCKCRSPGHPTEPLWSTPRVGRLSARKKQSAKLSGSRLGLAFAVATRVMAELGQERGGPGINRTSGGLGRGREADGIAQRLQPLDQRLGALRRTAAVEVIRPKILIDHAGLEHVVGSGEQRRGHRTDRLLRPAPGTQPVILSIKITAWAAGGRPGALHQHGLQPD